MSKKARTSRWDELCARVQVEDGLPTRESGYWAKQKLWFWNRYIEITTTAMVGHPHWPAGVVYVDLFAGPGVCTVRRTTERIPGSPLIAANAPKAFHKILLCEQDPELAAACDSRLSAWVLQDRYRVFVGDCNERVGEICREIPQRALTLAFLDPTGLHLWFETVRTLANCGAVDLLILYPDAVDILRNVDRYRHDPNSNLDRVLGSGSKWRKQLNELPSPESHARRRLAAHIYKEQLRRMAGYAYFRDEVINGPRGPLYRLIYATKDKCGVDFWDKSVAKQFGGIRRLFLLRL